MSRAWLPIGAAVLALACSATTATAQQQTVFVHGLKSSGDSWAEAAQRLSEALAIDAKRPTLDWSAQYDDQALALNQNGALAGSNLVVGHSNGGVVARSWARLRPLDGIVTIGTPHGGAPLVSNLGLYASYTTAAIRSIGSAGSGMTYLANTRTPVFGQCCNWWWLAQQVLNSLSVTTSLMNYGFSGMLVGLGLNVYAPVLGQMEPNSGFIRDLNRPESIDQEIGAVPARIGLVSSAPFLGGPFRAFAPDQADWVGRTIGGAAWTLYFVASELMAGAPPGDWEALDAASRLMAAGAYLDSFDASWCAAVSSVGMQYCDYNDAVVPIRSQIFPGAVNLYSGNQAGPAHVEETTRGIPWLFHALAEYAHVPRRSTPPAGGATRLHAGQGLGVGESVASPSGRVVLTYQGDGNLVLSENGAVVWAINCWSACIEIGPPGTAIMQGDGNFVVRDAGEAPVWHTTTWGHPGAYLAIQDDGNLVVYDGNDSVLWQR